MVKSILVSHPVEEHFGLRRTVSLELKPSGATERPLRHLMTRMLFVVDELLAASSANTKFWSPSKEHHALV